MYSKLLTELTNILPRRGIGEQKARDIILSFLEESNINYELQKFETTIPISDAKLFSDGIEIPCIGASFIDGKINKNSLLLSSFGAKKSDKPAIIFNPISEGICMQSYKDFPAIAINRMDAVKLIFANQIKGYVSVKNFTFESTNILVGNVKNPKNIIFAHYDSIIGAGAVDNAGSVDVLYSTFVGTPELLKDNLFVFIAAEEETISKPEGFHGFSEFDKQYHKLLAQSKKIFVLDGVGITEAEFVQHHIDWVFDAKNLKTLQHKIYWMWNDQTEVMKYYHSELDTIDKLNKEFLKQAHELLFNSISA